MRQIQVEATPLTTLAPQHAQSEPSLMLPHAAAGRTMPSAERRAPSAERRAPSAEALTAPRAREQCCPPLPPDRLPPPPSPGAEPSRAEPPPLATARPHGRLRRAVAAWLLALLAAAPASAQTSTSISLITVQTSPASGDTYTRGEVVRVRVKFDGEVEVTHRHLLRLALTVGSDTKQAPAVTGSGRDLLFAYTVEASDLDDDGISIPADPLSLNGGAITVSGDPMTAVTLTHSGIADDATQKVNGSAVVAPTVQTILFTSTPVMGDTFRRGETITVAATFDTAVIVRGDPQFALTIGTNVRNASRQYSSGAASVSVSFHYTVVGADVDNDGISVAANALSLNGGAIQLADGTTAADITHDAVAADPHPQGGRHSRRGTYGDERLRPFPAGRRNGLPAGRGDSRPCRLR